MVPVDHRQTQVVAAPCRSFHCFAFFLDALDMTARIVRLGSPRPPGEGLRIGTVRRPPRGVPRTEYASRDFYDVWFPNLAPSEALLKES
jgi:hypothetical protein